MKTLDYQSARMTLVGAVIRQAVVDSYSHNLELRREARNFIYTDRIVDFLKTFHLDGKVNIPMLRHNLKTKHCAFYLHKENRPVAEADIPEIKEEKEVALV